MNFDFSDDQKALKEDVRKFLSAKCPPDRVRGLMEEGSAGHDPELWADIIEQGWAGAAIPEEFGGLGLGYLELCCISEELGRAVAPLPFASTVYFFAEALLRAGTPEQKAKYLPQVVTGELIGTIASAEQAGAVSAANISAEVSGGKLTGVKLPVTDGDGFPVQQRGITAWPGLYFVGLPYLHTQKSGLLVGVGDDAAFIASHIATGKISNT